MNIKINLTDFNGNQVLSIKRISTYGVELVILPDGSTDKQVRLLMSVEQYNNMKTFFRSD